MLAVQPSTSSRSVAFNDPSRCPSTDAEGELRAACEELPEEFPVEYLPPGTPPYQVELHPHPAKQKKAAQMCKRRRDALWKAVLTQRARARAVAQTPATLVEAPPRIEREPSSFSQPCHAHH